MTVLARDHQASILGVDLSHSGLYCRFGRGCSEHWNPSRSDDEQALHVAALRRDSHEQVVHGYRHQRLRDNTWSFTKMFSRKEK